MSGPERLGSILAGLGWPRPAPERDYLAELQPAGCRTCGAPTGSVALSECQGCERARAAVEAVHRLAVESHARARLAHYERMGGGA